MTITASLMSERVKEALDEMAANKLQAMEERAKFERFIESLEQRIASLEAKIDLFSGVSSIERGSTE